MRRLSLTAGLIAAAALSGCAAARPPPPPPGPPKPPVVVAELAPPRAKAASTPRTAAEPHAALPQLSLADTVAPALRAATARAERAALAMSRRIGARVTSMVGELGAAAALAAYREESALLVKHGADEGIELGRTSDRLRSPRNAPPRWAAQHVAAAAGKRADDVEALAVDLGDRVGVLLPLADRPSCTSCHGARDELAADVGAQLAREYPDDAATGYAPGDLRGFAWAVARK